MTSPAVRPLPAHAVSALDVDVEIVQVADVEDDPAVRRAVADAAVAPAPDGELEPGLPGHGDHRRDVGRVGNAGDHGGPAVEPPYMIVRAAS